jgi:hypothetical protein
MSKGPAYSQRFAWPSTTSSDAPKKSVHEVVERQTVTTDLGGGRESRVGGFSGPSSASAE